MDNTNQTDPAIGSNSNNDNLNPTTNFPVGDSGTARFDSSMTVSSNQPVNTVQDNQFPVGSNLQNTNETVLSAAPVPSSGTAASEVPVNNSVNTKKPNMIILSLAVLFIGALAGLGLYATGMFRGNLLRMGQTVSKPPLQVIVDNNEKIIIGTDATYPPMEFKDKNNNLTGFDIELANEIGKELNTSIEFRDIPFDNIFDALDNKEIDMIISSVTITDERKLKYDFSEPYINAGQVMVTTKKVQQAHWTTADLAKKRIGVQKGTTSEIEALKYTSRNNVIAYADYPQAVTALSDGLIDLIIVDLTAAKGLLDENESLQIVSDPFTNEYYGVVFRKGEESMKADFDKVILSLQKRGILNNIKQKWFQ